MKPNKKSTSTHGLSLKQGTLGFTSIKRTTSAADTKGKKLLKPTAAPVSAYKKRKSTDSSASTDSTSSSNDEDVHTIEHVPRLAGKQSSGATGRDGLKNVQTSDETLELLEKSGKLLAHYKGMVKAKMGNAKPIHQEGQTKMHQILRVFDLSVEYGPCVGVSRLERWERARVLGLNPPTEVRDILLTKEAVADTQYSYSVFHDQV